MMTLNRLLSYCLNQRTSVGDAGLGVSIDAREGERILFFRVDCDGFRTAFKIANTVPLCDALVFYRRDGFPPQLIFVEFKGGDADRAIAQIESSIEVVRPTIPRSVMKPKITGLVLLTGGVPRRRNPVAPQRGFELVQKSVQRGKRNTDLRDCGVL